MPVKKLLHLYKTFYPFTCGGVEQVIRQIALGSKKYYPYQFEHRVVCVAPVREPREYTYEGIVVFAYPSTFDIRSTPFSLSLWRHFKEHVQWADVLYYHFPWPFADLLHFAHRHLIRERRVKSWMIYHSDVVKQRFLKRLYSPLMHYFLGQMDRILATSTTYAATSPVLSAPRFSRKVEVVPLALDPSTYPKPTPEQVEPWVEKFGRDFFLFVGVLRYYKGLHILLEALRGLDYPLLIVGSGPMEKKLKRLAKAWHLSQVHFVGAVDESDKAALLSLAKAVVLPSTHRSEAFGLCLLEGLLFQKPLLSTELGTGTSDINRRGITGLVVPAGDVAALRAALMELRAWDASELPNTWQMGQRFQQFLTGALGQISQRIPRVRSATSLPAIH